MLPTAEVTRLIPQRMPIVMISQLLEAGASKVVTTLTIDENNLFLENGVLTESGLLENIAQTAAAGVGYRHIANNHPVPVGFIASVRDFQVFSFPKVSTTITTHLVEIQEVMGVLIVEGTVYNGESKIASAEMRIFAANDR